MNNNFTNKVLRIAKNVFARGIDIRRNELDRYLVKVNKYNTHSKYEVQAYWGQVKSKTNQEYYLWALYTSKSTYPKRCRLVDTEQDCLKELKSQVKSFEDMYDRKKKDREEFQNPYKVGDILYSSWGYDQTNINFYKVTKVTGNSVYLVELSTSIISSDGYGSDKVKPGKPCGSQFMRRVASGRYDNYVKISHSQYAHKWNGETLEQTSFGWGH